MALQLKTLASQGGIWKNSYVKIKPTLLIKQEITNDDKTTKHVFLQKYDVVVSSDNGNFNYEAETLIDIESPTYSQCYEHLKNQPEFKTAENA